jgi:polysaccharide biosynthesis transport protein
MELLRFAAVLARRRFLVGESIALFTLVAVLVALLAPRTYTASARVLIAPSDTTASILTDLDLAEIASGMTSASKDIENHIALATTRPILEEVIWRLQLRDESGRLYAAHDLLAPTLFARFVAQPSVTVTSQQGTHLLVFTASAPDPETARLLADSVVLVAIETTEAHAQAESRHAREFVETQLGLVKTEFDHALEQIADAENKQAVIDLQSEMDAAIGRLSSLLLTYENNAAAVEETRARRDANRARGAPSGELDSQLAGLEEKGRELDSAVERMTVAFGQYPDKMRSLTQLQLAADAAQGVYEALSKQRYQIAVAEQMTLSDLQLVEGAQAPTRPSFPRPWFLLATGVLFGAMVGIGSALLLEYVDDTVKTPEDLALVWDARSLGVVPRFEGGATIDARPLTDPLAESWRTIRNALSDAGRDKPLVRVAVTSAMAGDGKSTCAWNLAVSFAREGKRVLLVDGDLRRPSLHRHVGVANGVGLTSVLLGEATLDEAIEPTTVACLSLLPSGPPTSDPARLVESLRLRQLLLDVEKTCDVAIVDTPPLLVVNDALVIARAVDGLVVVVESGKTSRRQIAELASRLAGAAIAPLGVVLNKVPLQALGYRPYLSARSEDGPREQTGGAA